MKLHLIITYFNESTRTKQNHYSDLKIIEIRKGQQNKIIELDEKFNNNYLEYETKIHMQ
jgi:hypothetical protein